MNRGIIFVNKFLTGIKSLIIQSSNTFHCQRDHSKMLVVEVMERWIDKHHKMHSGNKDFLIWQMELAKKIDTSWYNDIKL